MFPQGEAAPGGAGRAHAPFAVLAGVAGLARRALVAAVSKALAGRGEPDRTIKRCQMGGGAKGCPG